jgi:hypothetical protein
MHLVLSVCTRGFRLQQMRGRRVGGSQLRLPAVAELRFAGCGCEEHTPAYCPRRVVRRNTTGLSFRRGSA